MTFLVDAPALPSPSFPADWTALDTRAVNTARVLAADAVQKVGNGHPGTAMSLAPLAYTLFQRVMRHDPADPAWVGRDRFVLSCGHSSLTLYVQLYLSGYGLELDDLKALRTWGSLTPGHPEHGHTAGVEITTGPLGQGLASAVGMAMAARRERGLFDPDAPAGQSLFDHLVYVLASDGDIQEGVTAEASSLAGRQQLGNLIVFHDDNGISIEDDTAIAIDEDVAARYEAYGWHVQKVAGGENVAGLLAAIEQAKAETTRPSFIQVRTIIGYPAPTLMNTGKVHGSALGTTEVAAVKEILGFDPAQSFAVDADVLTHTRSVAERGAHAKAAWQRSFEEWAQSRPEGKELFDRLSARRLPEGWDGVLPAWEPDAKGMATRAASGKVLNAIGPVLPELWGGSADLAESNNTTIADADSFGPAVAGTGHWNAQPYGRTLHFGIREHAMGAVLSGIALHGPTRPYGGTFLTFSDYMRGAVRLAAVMGVPVTYVWTHDSIGLGEDGPTHQPVEHLAALRAIPGLSVVRPADANETAFAWRALLERDHGPGALCLTRQGVPVLEGTSYHGVRRGGYVLADADADGDLDVILIATGSEVQIALEARNQLRHFGIGARVVSMPCVEWFEEQDEEYRESVLPSGVDARVSVEAGIAQPWWRFIGRAGRAISLEHFGASADAATLYREFGITAAAVVAAARQTLVARPLSRLASHGVSLWLDDLSRTLLRSGQLADLVKTRGVVGVTSNPTIFQAALADGDAYREQVGALAARGAGAEEAVRELTTNDVRDAADLLAPLFIETGGRDGRVSLEVDPRLAHDTEETITQALELSALVDRPNLMIKIPATAAGLPAITRVVAAGISVNVTLIFSTQRYAQVIHAYQTGLEQARDNGHDLSTIHSVASFFVSRVDAEVDRRLREAGAPPELFGRAAIANARLGYRLHEDLFATDRWAALAELGAHVQRPLWASTGVKDPAYDPTRYVTELVAAGTVNTAPLATIEVVARQGVVSGDTVTRHHEDAARTLAAVEAHGVDLTEVCEVLEEQGVEKFEQSWNTLLSAMEQTLTTAD